MYAEFLRYHGFAPTAVSSVSNALRHDDGTMRKPIIVLTACVYRRDRERAEHAGCDVFLPKPRPPNNLLREVRLLVPATNCDTCAQTGETRRAFQHPSNSTTLDERGWNRADPRSCELARQS